MSQYPKIPESGLMQIKPECDSAMKIKEKTMEELNYSEDASKRFY